MHAARQPSTVAAQIKKHAGPGGERTNQVRDEMPHAARLLVCAFHPLAFEAVTTHARLTATGRRVAAIRSQAWRALRVEVHRVTLTEQPRESVKVTFGGTMISWISTIFLSALVV